LPKAKIHILGIPKMLVVDFNDFILNADQEMVKYFFSKVHQVAKDAGLDKSGFRIITNNGSDAGQEVPHFHIHILGGESLIG
jgi:diadenosine tetraphosphate (Ap4A) HIT family hydrolase